MWVDSLSGLYGTKLGAHGDNMASGWYVVENGVRKIKFPKPEMD